MSKNSHKTLRLRIIRHLREWHRRLGIIAAFFLIFLSLSGIALNHTETLSLGHKPIKSSLLLDFYGIQKPSDVRFYLNDKLAVTNNIVWLNHHKILETQMPVVSAGLFSSMILIVTENQLYLFDQHGQMLDALDSASGLPENIKALHIGVQNIILLSGNGYYQTDQDLFDWQEIQPLTEPVWQRKTVPENEDYQQLILNYRAQFLTLERIIVDAHSGRIFGLFGVIMMDIMAILLILLSCSGVYIWLRYAKSKR